MDGSSVNPYLTDNLKAALELFGRSRENCAAVRKAFLVVERIRKEGIFDARRRGGAPVTAPVFKAQFEELARRIRRHRSACRICHNFLQRLSGKARKEQPVFLPGEA